MRRMRATTENTPITVDTVDMTSIWRLFNPATHTSAICTSHTTVDRGPQVTAFAQSSHTTTTPQRLYNYWKELWRGCGVVVVWLWCGCGHWSGYGVTWLGEGCHLWTTVPYPLETVNAPSFLWIPVDQCFRHPRVSAVKNTKKGIYGH